MDAIRPRDLGTILSVGARPVDETYLPGAVMAAAVAGGQRVVCATASAGGARGHHRLLAHSARHP